MKNTTNHLIPAEFSTINPTNSKEENSRHSSVENTRKYIIGAVAGLGLASIATVATVATGSSLKNYYSDTNHPSSDYTRERERAENRLEKIEMHVGTKIPLTTYQECRDFSEVDSSLRDSHDLAFSMVSPFMYYSIPKTISKPVGHFWAYTTEKPIISSIDNLEKCLEKKIPGFAIKK